MNDKTSFIMYTEYMEYLEMLDLEQRGVLITNLMAFQLDQELLEMDAVTKMAFTFIKNQIVRANEKYSEICEARSNAGKKGGRPRKANAFSDLGNEETEKQKKAKKANGFFAFPEESKKKQKKLNDNDNDNENENEHEHDNEDVHDNDNENDISNDIVSQFNSICVSLTPIKSLSGYQRLTLISLLDEFSADDFILAFEKTEASDFLSGRLPGKQWRATFNWLLNANHLSKVLSDDYINYDSTSDDDVFKIYAEGG